MQYRQKLDDVERRFAELETQMADPEVISDAEKYRKITKSQSDLREIVSKYREWKVANGNLEQARAMLSESDPDLKAMAQEEIAQIEPALTRYEEELRVLMLPKDPNDEKDAGPETRA